MWQPIDTAPKDGSRILVKTETGSPHVAAYSYYNNRFYDVWDTDLLLENLTKWHPLPPDDKKQESTINNDLLNWINLLNSVVCLLPDVSRENTETLIKARNKVIK
jgi:hypothetical protein